MSLAPFPRVWTRLPLYSYGTTTISKSSPDMNGFQKFQIRINYTNGHSNCNYRVDLLEYTSTRVHMTAVVTIGIINSYLEFLKTIHIRTIGYSYYY
jgi:hypothetical protein